MDLLTILQVLDSTMRLAVPLCWPVLQGCIPNAPVFLISG